MRTNSIKLAPAAPAGCSGWGYVLGHEMGHMLCPTCDHAPEGVFSEYLALGEQHRIGHDTLATVCAGAPCPVFAPEL